MKTSQLIRQIGSNIVFGLFAISATACNSQYNSFLPTQSAQAADRPTYKTDALIYHGTAAATDDPESISQILDEHRITYETVNSAELDALSLDELSQYGMIIWPGGYAGAMSDSLDPSTRERIRKAVTERGVSFVGICAGAFIAISPPTLPGDKGPDWGFSIIPAPILPYYHLEDEGTEEAMVKLKLPNGKSRSLLWWGGPTLPEIPNGVIARYSDTNEPAMIQTHAGKGMVVLSGPHPEAPQSWYEKLDLTDSDGLDHDLAWSMFNAALKRETLTTVQ